VYLRYHNHMGNERLHEIPARLFEGLNAAEIRGMGFDKRSVEIVLAD